MHERGGAPANASVRDARLFALSVTALFVALGVAGVLRHEMWRDEVQAWLIAHASGSPVDLIRNMRTETHPALWHATLWLLTRVTQSLRAFQFYHLALASLGVFLLCRYAPFRRWEKLLLSLGYFSLYEYALVARSYVMGVVLVYAFCAALPRRRHGLLALLLFFLTQTSLHGAILACGLALFLAMDGTARSAETGAGRWRPLLPVLLATAAGVALTGLQVSTAYAPNRYEQGAPDIMRSLDVLQGFERSFLPIQNLAAKMVWGSNVLPESLSQTAIGPSGARWATAAVSLFVAILASAALAARRRALLFFVATSAALLAFGFIVFQGAIRHHGHLFIAFVAALWLARLPQGEEPAPHPAPTPAASPGLASAARAAARIALPVIFTAQAAGGLIAWGCDLARPFSMASQTARFIRAERLDALPLFGDRAPPASSLQPYLERPVTYLADGRRGGYIVWGPAMWSKSPDPGRMWAGYMRETLGTPQSEALLILNYQLPNAPTGYRVREIRRFSGSLVGDEDYFLYVVGRESAGAR